MKRIYRDRFYLIESIPGISGFQRWDEREFRLVTGHKARLNRLSVVCEYVPGHGRPDTFRLEDGRLPEYQQVVDVGQAIAYLVREPFGSALSIPTHEVRGEEG